MWYGIKIIGYMCLGFMVFLIVSTIIVNQIRRNESAKEAIIAEAMKPECHPIIESLDGKVILVYPCTNTKEDL